MESEIQKNRFRQEREELKKMERTVNNCPFRTRYHIMPPVGWLNDPNGLCQFRGIYHAYFQYSPLSVHGGGGYWGHCTSTDLIHWKYKEPVLTTDIPEDAGGVYSGSALIENDHMYLFYTGNVKLPGNYDYIDSGRISTQILTESDDGQHMSGKTKLLGVEDYPENITRHVRDPKVWKEEGTYYMVLGARARAWDKEGERSDRGGVLIYTSQDKKNWSLWSELVPDKKFGYMWECPDIFVLSGTRVLSYCPQGLPAGEEKYQNIYQSGYSILPVGITAKIDSVFREWDPEDTFREWDMGFDFYAPQRFETEDGRRILIGWAGVPDTENAHRNLSVENGWQHCLTLPTELVYHSGKIFRKPVSELSNLPWKDVAADKADGKYRKYHWADQAVAVKEDGIAGGERCLLIGREDNGLTIHVAGDKVELTFLNRDRQPSICGGGRRVRIGRVEDRVEELLVLIDSSIVEVFVNGGETVFTTRIYLDKKDRNLAADGRCRILAI